MNKFTVYISSLLAAALLAVALPALARVVIDQYGTVLVQPGEVLSSESGSDGSDGDSSGSSGSGSDSDDNDSSGSSDDEDTVTSSSGSSGSSSGSSKTKTETRSQDGTRTKTEIRPDGETRTEVRLPDGTKIKTRNEDGRMRTDVYQGIFKVRFEREGDRFRIKAENEAGEEVELPDRDADELADDDASELTGILAQVGDTYQITMAGVTYTVVPAPGLALGSLVGQLVEVEGTFSEVSPTTMTVTEAKLEDAEDEDEIVIAEHADRQRILVRALQHKAIVERLNVQALTDLPISVDLATNTLSVTTPAGEKILTVLPDQAVQHILAANIIDRLGGQALVEEVRQGNVQTLGQVIELGVRNNLPVYQIQGFKDQRLFGFFPVTTNVTASVSVETGEIVDTNVSLLDRLISAVSTG